MSQTVLLTAAEEDCNEIKPLLDDKKAELIHAPLEVYEIKKEDPQIPDVLNNLDSFENIVHSSVRNVRFFMQQVESHEKKDAVTDCLNLTFNKETFVWLEEHGIPAVHSQNGEKPIDLVELMLRLQRMGKTLYPCGSHQREDFPGFMEELDIEVVELDVFDLKGPGDEALAGYQEELKEQQPDAVIFHSRRSVTRTLTAFPDLDYHEATVISADKGITNKLEEKGLSADEQADGSWASIAALL